jgi:hypothetical protein
VLAPWRLTVAEVLRWQRADCCLRLAVVASSLLGFGCVVRSARCDGWLELVGGQWAQRGAVGRASFPGFSV